MALKPAYFKSVESLPFFVTRKLPGISRPIGKSIGEPAPGSDAFGPEKLMSNRTMEWKIRSVGSLPLFVLFYFYAK